MLGGSSSLPRAPVLPFHLISMLAAVFLSPPYVPTSAAPSTIITCHEGDGPYRVQNTPAMQCSKVFRLYVFFELCVEGYPTKT